MTGRLAGALGLVLLVAALVLGALAADRLAAGTETALELDLATPAIGTATDVRARVRREAPGIANAALILEQGDRSVELDRFDAAPARGSPWPAGGEVRLEAKVGRGSPSWLAEGEGILRLVVTPRAGFGRSGPTRSVERRVAIRFRPPTLERLSELPAPGAGGSGLVAFRVAPHVVASGIEVDGIRSLSSPAPDAPGVRFVVLALPHDVGPDRAPVLFAEDDAGHRTEQLLFEHWPDPTLRHDTIAIDAAFLERVVPPLVARVPEVELPDDPLGRYLWVNRELRARSRASVADLSGGSAPAFLWRGAFVGLENAATTGRFGDQRTYTYQADTIDRQVHLGLDLASTSRAPVLAPNAGKVRFVGPLGIYGNTVIVDHGFGLTSLLAHLSRIGVEKGQWVTRGQEVGRTGSTGLSGGDHLHWGLFVHGVAIDPEPWLDPEWVDGPVQEVLAQLIDPGPRAER